MTESGEILRYFEQISQVPRGSGNHQGILQFLGDWAKGEGFSYEIDPHHNMVIRIPPSPGYEGAPLLVLQGHWDMVCEKTPGSSHDFRKDPLKLVQKGEWLYGDNTTLGADNGIALALAMDMATSEDVVHPGLEILITADEEVGLMGANELAKDFVKGRILINLDSEDEGVFTVGCAGGGESPLSVPVGGEAADRGQTFYKLTVGGLLGGHSGVDIAKNRENAIKMVERVLRSLQERDPAFRLASLQGGSGSHNAICRDAQALFCTAGDPEAEVKRWEATFKEEAGAVEKSLFVSLEKGLPPEQVLTKDSTKQMLDFIKVFPHGIAKMSSEIPGMVELSSNFAWTKVEPQGAHFLSSQRSALMSGLTDLNQRLEALASLVGGTCETKNNYPSWKPNLSSPLLEKAKEIYTGVLGREPRVEAIHAGLECGIIGAKYEGMDMISIGPTIESPHTPQERLFLPSLGPFRLFLVELLKSFR